MIVDYTFQCYAFKMINLSDLEIDVSSGGIDNALGIKMSSGLGKLDNLEKLELRMNKNKK